MGMSACFDNVIEMIFKVPQQLKYTEQKLHNNKQSIKQIIMYKKID